jgi:hypothetical protein
MVKYMLSYDDFISEGNEAVTSTADILESANRIRKLMENGDDFGIIGAYNPLDDEETNAKDQVRLEEGVMKLTDGYIPFTAGYSYPDKKRATKIELKLLFVPEIELKDLLKLGREYSQETVIFGNRQGVDSYRMDGKKEISLTMPDIMFAFCTVMFNPGSFK